MHSMSKIDEYIENRSKRDANFAKSSGKRQGES